MRKTTAVQLTKHAVLLMGVVVMVIPYFFMIGTALKQQSQIFDIPPKIFPDNPTLENFEELFRTGGIVRYFMNSLFVALFSTAGTVLCSSMLAYVFARVEFRLRKFLYSLILLGMMIPPVMLIIPQFITTKNLGLLNTPFALILVYVCMNIPMQTFLLRGFFEDIPREIEEAALIDGASKPRIFFSVMLPLTRPGLAVVSIFTFLYSWDEFPWANVAVNKDQLRTLPIALAFFQSQHLTEWGMVFAGALFAVVPVIVIFVIFQRYFVAGISTTGMKG